jgi:hypothetical protein
MDIRLGKAASQAKADPGCPVEGDPSPPRSWRPRGLRRRSGWPARYWWAAVSEIGRSSFKMEYEIFHRGTDERVADGFGVIVWVDYGTRNSSPLPEGLKAAIRVFEGMG